MKTLCAALMIAVACGPNSASTTHGTGGGSAQNGGGTGATGGSGATGGDAAGGSASGGGSSSGGSGTGGSGGAQSGCEGQTNGCYTVFAHSDHVLYSIDLMSKALTLVGPFNAPNVGGSEDVITDLAVAPNGTIWVVSNTTLYTAALTDGHVTKVGALSACGQDNVALTLLPDARMFVADFKGQLCTVDYTATPPVVTPVAKLGSGMAISGDLVAVGDGTLYGSAYLLSDGSNTGTQTDNVLVKIDPATAAVTKLGPTGFPKLFGVAYALGKVFGFTHDQTGRVVTIDPTTGVGTLFNTFEDPTTHQKISFAGAGVNALVSPTIN